MEINEEIILDNFIRLRFSAFYLTLAGIGVLGLNWKSKAELKAYFRLMKTHSYVNGKQLHWSDTL